VHPEDVEATLEAVAIQDAGGEVSSFQNRYRCKDGTYRWLEWTSRPDPKAREMIAVARDITDRKDLEARELAYKSILESEVHERTRDLEERSRELEKIAFDLVESNHETLGRLAIAAEYRDDDTHAHTQRVSNIAGRIAEALDLDPASVELIREAAILHDVGKIGIPDSILFKPGKLTRDEFEMMKSHTKIGWSILTDSYSDILRAAAEIAAAHHEWWDGSGYPDGKAGEEIPLFGRIVALADVFDALTHERPYKQAWPLADALAEIQRLRGQQFDPEVVDGFQQLDFHELTDLLVADGHSYAHNGAIY
jgi:putative two-component system response regulator